MPAATVTRGPRMQNNSRHIMQDVIKSYSLYYLIEMIKTLL